MKITALAALFLAATTINSFAQDASSTEKNSAVAVNWSGAYSGIQTGYSWAKHSETETIKPSTFSYTEDFTSGGAITSVFAGYNWQIDRYVIGIDANAEHSNLHDGYEMIGGATEMAIDWQGEARLRAGLALDQYLVFIAGGIAVADAKYRFWDAGVIDETFNKTLWGWTIGFGADYAITENLFARAEYRYTDFNDTILDPQNAWSGAYYTDTTKQHSVRLGLAVKF